jgi:hypothetical protein
LLNQLTTFLALLDYAIHSLNIRTNNVNNPSLSYGILDQVLHPPDMYNLNGRSIDHLQEILQIFAKLDLEWLLNAV